MRSFPSDEERRSWFYTTPITVVWLCGTWTTVNSSLSFDFSPAGCPEPVT